MLVKFVNPNVMFRNRNCSAYNVSSTSVAGRQRSGTVYVDNRTHYFHFNSLASALVKNGQLSTFLANRSRQDQVNTLANRLGLSVETPDPKVLIFGRWHDGEFSTSSKGAFAHPEVCRLAATYFWEATRAAGVAAPGEFLAIVDELIAQVELRKAAATPANIQVSAQTPELSVTEAEKNASSFTAVLELFSSMISKLLDLNVAMITRGEKAIAEFKQAADRMISFNADLMRSSDNMAAQAAQMNGIVLNLVTQNERLNNVTDRVQKVVGARDSNEGRTPLPATDQMVNKLMRTKDTEPIVVMVPTEGVPVSNEGVSQ